MRAPHTGFGVGTIVLAVLTASLLSTTSPATADSFVIVTPDGTVALKEASVAVAPQVTVNDYDDAGLRLSMDVPGLALRPRKIKDVNFVVVDWPDASIAGEIGAPGLPVVRRIFIAPHGAAVTAHAAVNAPVVITLEIAVPLIAPNIAEARMQDFTAPARLFRAIARARFEIALPPPEA